MNFIAKVSFEYNGDGSKRMCHETYSAKGVLFRDHTWLGRYSATHTYIQFSGEQHLYQQQSKIGIKYIKHLKDYQMKVTTHRRANTVIIEAFTPIKELQDDIANSVDDTNTQVQRYFSTSSNSSVILEITTISLELAKSLTTSIKTAVTSGAELTTILDTIFNSIVPNTAIKPQIETGHDVQVKVVFPKYLLKLFKMFKDVKSVFVTEAPMAVTRTSLELNGLTIDMHKQVFATGTQYKYENITISEAFIKEVSTRIQGELVTTAIMNPTNFIGIKGEYLLTNINEEEIAIHNSLINRHGEVFIIEKVNDIYYEANTDQTIPLPVEILNIRTLKELI